SPETHWPRSKSYVLFLAGPYIRARPVRYEWRNNWSRVERVPVWIEELRHGAGPRRAGEGTLRALGCGICVDGHRAGGPRWGRHRENRCPRQERIPGKTHHPRDEGEWRLLAMARTFHTLRTGTARSARHDARRHVRHPAPVAGRNGGIRR